MKNKNRGERKKKQKIIGYISFEVDIPGKRSHWLLDGNKARNFSRLVARCYPRHRATFPPLLPENKMLDLVHLDSILNGATMTNSEGTRNVWKTCAAKLHEIMQSKLDRTVYISVNPFENKRVALRSIFSERLLC